MICIVSAQDTCNRDSVIGHHTHCTPCLDTKCAWASNVTHSKQELKPECSNTYLQNGVHTSPSPTCCYLLYKIPCTGTRENILRIEHAA